MVQVLYTGLIANIGVDESDFFRWKLRGELFRSLLACRFVNFGDDDACPKP